MVTGIDRRRLAGTGVAEGHAKVLLDKIDELVAALNSVAAGMLPNGSVGTDELTDLCVTTAKLAAAAVETGKLADSAVTSDKLAALAVGTAKLAAAAVTAEKLAAGAVTNEKVAADAAIAGSKVACDASKPLDAFYSAAKALANELRTLVGASLAVAAVTIEHAADPGVVAARVVPSGLGTLASFGANGGGGGAFGLTGDGFPVKDDATAPALYYKGGALVANLASVGGVTNLLVLSGAGRFLPVQHDADPGTGGVAVQYASGALKATFADETNKTAALEPGFELLSRTRTVASAAIA